MFLCKIFYLSITVKNINEIFIAQNIILQVRIFIWVVPFLQSTGNIPELNKTFNHFSSLKSTDFGAIYRILKAC